ncbi:MAG: hypothetical protein H6Q92_1734 [Nitrospirae bacterium]|nr:hypothetical protein [Nitrospirota bacterium]
MTDRISTGSDIDSYCTKCKLMLEHIVVAMTGGTVVKVKCKTCGSIHRFKGMPAERTILPKAKGAAAKSAINIQVQWETAIDTASGIEKTYEMTGSYCPGDLIVHSVFGKGIVQKTFFNKCSVLFRDKERLLVTSNS